MMRNLISAMVIVALTVTAADTSAAAQDSRGWMWNNPTNKKIPGVVHATLKSPSMKRTVGFHVFLPPQYEAEKSRRFPVVYFLHGAGGSESSDVGIAWRVRAAIKAGKIPPVIFVFPNGGKRSGYRDWKDADVKAETLIVRELIPYVDKTYRTIADRKSRAVCGFSMGGGGALRLATKYPDLFCATASLAAAIDSNERDHGGDNAFRHAAKNAEKLRGKVAFMMVIGTKDFLYARHAPFLKTLDEHKIKYSYAALDGESHNLGRYMQQKGDELIEFIAGKLETKTE